MDVPAIFYKYRSLAGKDRDFVRDTIVGNNIYLAKPASFNDPFDCAPAYSPTITPEGAYALARRYLGREHPRWSEEKLDQEAQNFVRQTKGADMALVAQALRENNESIRNWLALYCVSAVKTSALMWAHYADSHRGICIGFASDADIFAKAQEVKYSHVRYTVDPVHDSNEQRLVNSLLLKSAHWKYEKEWRYIDFEHGPGKYQLPGSPIKEIILGARLSEADEVRVTNWVDRMAVKPDLFRASICPNHFKVNIETRKQT